MARNFRFAIKRRSELHLHQDNLVRYEFQIPNHSVWNYFSHFEVVVRCADKNRDFLYSIDQSIKQTSSSHKQISNSIHFHFVLYFASFVSSSIPIERSFNASGGKNWSHWFTNSAKLVFTISPFSFVYLITPFVLMMKIFPLSTPARIYDCSSVGRLPKPPTNGECSIVNVSLIDRNTGILNSWGFRRTTSRMSEANVRLGEQIIGPFGI